MDASAQFSNIVDMFAAVVILILIVYAQFELYKKHKKRWSNNDKAILVFVPAALVAITFIFSYFLYGKPRTGKFTVISPESFAEETFVKSLKPCALCGEEPELSVLYNGEWSATIRCQDHDTNAITGIDTGKDNHFLMRLITAWNVQQLDLRESDEQPEETAGDKAEES
ncbi:MAG: hypothetical protein ACOX5R_19815 [bacterium]